MLNNKKKGQKFTGKALVPPFHIRLSDYLTILFIEETAINLFLWMGEL
jgi:hypothetical protein